MLSRYQQYVCQFTHCAAFAEPNGGPDQKLDSPMLDLLGVRYLVVDRTFEEEQNLKNLPTFERVFSDIDWCKVYRNKDHMPKAWFYPNAYTLSDEPSELALMNSSWFEPQQSLLLGRENLQTSKLYKAEALPTISLKADQITQFSENAGVATNDSDCSEPQLKFAYWNSKGSWMQFNIEGPTVRGRYLLLIRYTAPDLDPSLIAEVTQGDHRQVSGPVTLPRSRNWNCKTTRSAQLGEFELAPGPHQVRLTQTGKSEVAMFSLWLVRVPEHEASRVGKFSFENFDISANRISFEARLNQDGYVFLNEIDYPGWTATVDGQETEVLRADSIFRAVQVSAGSHRIEFRFWPRFLIPGAAVSLATLAGVWLAWMALQQDKKGSRAKVGQKLTAETLSRRETEDKID